MKKLLAALVAALGLAFVCGTASAQPAVGTHSYSPATGWTPNAFPDPESFVVATHQKISWNKFQIGTAGGQPLANAGTSTGIFYAWPYAFRMVQVAMRTDLSASPSSAVIYFYSAEDSAGPYRPVMIAKSGAVAGNFASFGDTTGMDTLKIYLPFRGRSASAIPEFTFPIPNYLYLGKYVKLMATKADTTSGQVDSVTVSATWVVRK